MDTRKLITTFLVLAVVTSTVSLFFSAFKKTNSSNIENLVFYGERAGETQTGALAEQIPGTTQIVEGYTPTAITTDLDAPNPNNLTEVFIYNLAGELVRANPEGPSLLGGQSAITPPNGDTLNTFLDSYLGGSAFTRVSVEDMAKDITRAPAHSSLELQAYTEGVNTILGTTLAGPSYERVTAREPSMEAIHATLLLLDEAIEKLKLLPVPEPLTKYHSALLASLVNRRLLMQAAAEYETDPIKAIFAARAGSIILTEDAETLRNEGKAIESLLSKAGTDQRNKTAFIPYIFMNIFGAHKAHAFFGVPSVEVGMSWFQMILEWVQKLGTEILKNQIVHKLVSQVITWVQGKGNPQFITDWKSFLETSLKDGAIDALVNINSNICAPFRGVIQAHLRDLVAPYDNIPRCTLDQITGNLTAFYDDFRQNGGVGSWVSFANGAAPSSNIFGQLFSAGMFVGDQALKTKEATNEEARSGEGFIGEKLCIRWEKAGAQTVCSPEPGCDPTQQTCQEVCREIPGSGSQRCVEYEQGTPPSLVKEITNRAVANSPIEHIVNVQDLEALVAALVDTMLNKITKGGFTLLTGSQRDTGRTSNTGGGFDPCAGLTDPEATACRNNTRPSTPRSTPSHFFPTTPPGTPPPPPTACASVPGGTATPPCSTLTPGSPAFDACYAACY